VHQSGSVLGPRCRQDDWHLDQVTTSRFFLCVCRSVLTVSTSNSKSLRAIEKREPIRQVLLVTRYQAERVATQNMLSVKDISDMLGIPVVGVVPESEDVLNNTNVGQPVILGQGDAATGYRDAV
jgi:septum site-determining protein MinD